MTTTRLATSLSRSILLCLAAAALAGGTCGVGTPDGGDPDCVGADCGPDFSPGTGVVVRIVPDRPVVPRLGKLKFVATVDFPDSDGGYTDQAIVWRVMTPGGGVVEQDGTYTAPTELGTARVRATSVAEPRAFAEAIVRIGPSIELTPSTVRVQLGRTQRITARVFGLADPALTWSLDEGNSPETGLVDTTGLFSALTLGAFHVRATSVADPSVQGVALVLVREDVVPVVRPPEATDGGSEEDPDAGPPSLANSTSFLFEGPDPIQVGVAPGTIEPAQQANIRGLVTDVLGGPVPGALVTVADHPEYGSARTQANGFWDLAINGGGRQTVTIQADGYLPVQRSSFVAVGAWVHFDTAVLTVPEPACAVIDLSGQALVSQVAKARRVVDEDGAREPLLIFPPGITAQGLLPNKALVGLGTGTLRVTEFTVGAEGPDAMPAELPPGTEYTYAVEYDFDEARKLGAEHVIFNKSVASYLDNFLGFPSGSVIPAGFYSFANTGWAPERDGAVVDYLGADANGLGQLDADGDGDAEPLSSLAAIGVTADELAALAGALGGAHRSLWRIPIAHFSTFDFNAFVQGPDGDPPSPPPPGRDSPPDECNNKCGSVIACESQVLGEAVQIDGTPFSLTHYSNRQLGYKHRIRIPLAPINELEFEVIAAEWAIDYAGHHLTGTEADLARVPVRVVELPDSDIYDIPIRYSAKAVVHVTWHVVSNYSAPTTGALNPGATFGQAVGASTGVRSRRPSKLKFTYDLQLGRYDAKDSHLGGWDLDAHHVLNDADGMLWMGEGTTRNLEMVEATITPILGQHNMDGFVGAGPTPASEVDVTPGPLLPLSDGFIMGSSAGIVRYRPDAQVELWAPTAALGSSLYPSAMAFDINGDLLVVESGGLYPLKLSRVSGGIKTALVEAGSGFFDSLPDGSIDPKTVGLRTPALAVHPDGDIFLFSGASERYANTVFRYRAGRLTPYARFAGPVADLLVRDRVLYAVGRHQRGTASSEYGIWQVEGPDRIRLVMPIDTVPELPDGSLRRLTPAPSGGIYLLDAAGSCVRWVSPYGRSFVVAGQCNNPPNMYSTQWRHEGAAKANWVPLFFGTTLADGRFIANNLRYTFEIRPAAGLLERAARMVPSDDGRHYFQFNAHGLHAKTIDALTGADVYTFAYDAGKRLTSITDVDGLVTTIDRSTAGEIKITAPNTRQTRLLLNSNGYVREVRRIGNRNTIVGVRGDGILGSFTDPEGARSTFSYDVAGRLIRHVGPTGAVQTLNRRELPTGYEIDYTSGMGRRTKYTVRTVRDLVERLTQAPNGLITSSFDSDSVTLTRTPDGTEYAAVGAPDPLVGMFTSFAGSSTITTPSRRILETTETREIQPARATLANFTSLKSETTVNQNTWTTHYDKATRTYTMTSPEGRVSTVKLDTKGRVIETDDAGSSPVTITWGTTANDKGQVTAITQGDRSLAIGYDTVRRRQTLTDALTNVVTLGYDTADRVNKVTVPGALDYSFAYDDADRLTSLTIPDEVPKVHSFTYDPRGLETKYAPPGVVLSPPVDTDRTWDADRSIGEVRRPDGDRLVPSRDSFGRLTGLQTSAGDYRSSYSTTTGHLESITSPQGIKLTYGRDGILPLTQQWTEGTTTIGWVGQDYRAEDWARSKVWVVGGGTNEPPDELELYYDDDGLLSGASHSLGAMQLTRDTAGRVSNLNVGALTVKPAYDGTYGDLSSIDTIDASESTVFRIDYVSRDALGRISEIKEKNDVGAFVRRQFTYDARGRLLTSRRSNTETGSFSDEFTYEYDENGNRTSRVEHGVATTVATYDAQDRLVSTITGGVTTTYAYTNTGMLKSKTTGSSVTRYQYDPTGNLVRVEVPATVGPPAISGHVVEYEYDGQNRRVARKLDGAVTHRWLWDGQLRIIAELGPDRVRTKTFIYAEGINSPQAMIHEGQVFGFAKDHLGSVRRVVNGSGDVVQEISYGPWGERAVSGEAIDDGIIPFGFAGGQYDSATGLVRFGVRDYLPGIGRWLARDPLRFHGGTSNYYEYSNSNPVCRLDPSGLYSSEELGLCFANPIDCSNAKDAADEANDFAVEQFPEDAVNPSPHTTVKDWGRANAVLHCVWSCLLTQRSGAEAAEEFGDAHERAGRDPEGPESDMDRCNNGVGREIGKDPTADCRQRCLKSTDLQVLK